MSRNPYETPRASDGSPPPKKQVGFRFVQLLAVVAFVASFLALRNVYVFADLKQGPAALVFRIQLVSQSFAAVAAISACLVSQLHRTAKRRLFFRSLISGAVVAFLSSAFLGVEFVLRARQIASDAWSWERDWPQLRHVIASETFIGLGIASVIALLWILCSCAVRLFIRPLSRDNGAS